MKFEFENVFITGSNGWLGKQLVLSLLNDDDEVLIFKKPMNIKINCLINIGESRDFFNGLGSNINIVEGDLRNIDTIKKFIYKSKKSLLIHTAGVIHPKRIKDFFEVNYVSTRNLINESVNKNFDKIIVISSNSPVGCNPNNKHLFNENSKYNPYMNYGKSKKLMEEFLIKKINKGIDITILRPPWFHGENMPSRQLLFYRLITSGKFPIIGNGLNLRSMANVKNICQAIFLASMKKVSKGKIYWVADEKNLNMLEIIDTIKDVFENEFKLKRKKNMIKLPYFFGQIFEKMDYFLQMFNIYSQKIHVLSELNKNIACDISLIKNELGYKPKVDLYNGTLKAYLQYLKLKNK